MIEDIKFYRNPEPYDIIKYQDDISWGDLSYYIERDFTKTEIRMFYDKIDFGDYTKKHNISDDDFEFLLKKGRIHFITRFHLCKKPNRINNDNIVMICADNSSLWNISFRNSDIDEEVLINNLDVIRNADFKEILKERSKQSDDAKYINLHLLLELND